MTQPDREFLHTCPLCGGHLYLLEAHLGTEVPCPHCAQTFTAREVDAMDLVEPEGHKPGRPRASPVSRSGTAGPGLHPCPACGGHMELLPEHSGVAVPCPHCGERFVPEPGDVVPLPRRPSPNLRGDSRGQAALYLGIAGLVGTVVGALCCNLLMPLGICAPIGLVIAWGPRREVRARGEVDSQLEAGFWLCVVTTVLLVLGVLAVATVIAVAIVSS